MTAQLVPLTPTPNQSLSLVLGDVTVAITLQTVGGALFATITAAGVPICAGRRCEDRVVLTDRAAYLGFPQLRLFFADLQGRDAPRWAEFGTRFVLAQDDPG